MRPGSSFQLCQQHDTLATSPTRARAHLSEPVEHDFTLTSGTNCTSSACNPKRPLGFWPLQKLPQRVPHGTPKLGRFRTEKNDWARHDPDRKMSRKLHHIGDRWRVRSISPPWARKMEQQSQNSDFWAGDGAGSMPTVRGALYPVWNIEAQKMPVERCDFPIQVAVPQSYFLHIGWFPSEND